MIAIILSPIYLLVCIYVLQWMLRWMTACHSVLGSAPFQYTFIAVYFLTATTLLSSFLIKHPIWLRRTLKKISNLWLGIFFYTLAGIGIADLLRILLHLFRISQQSWYPSHVLFLFTGALTGFLILTLGMYGTCHARKLYTTTYHISLSKKCRLGKTLDIALIADLHLGYNTDELLLSNMVNRINDAHPDLVVIAGDTFDNEFQAIHNPDQCARILRKLNSTYGTFACYGNHDLDEKILAGFTFGGQLPEADQRFQSFFREAGITLLEDEVRLISESFYLIGRKDPSRCRKLLCEGTRMTPKKLTENLDHTRPVFVIDHQPRELNALADAGVDLDLSGHTHNGQLFPGNLLLKFICENPYGVRRKKDMFSVVTSGAGIWGPGMRIGTKSEICIVKIMFA